MEPLYSKRQTKRLAGRVSPGMLVLLGVLGLALAGVVILALNRSGLDDAPPDTPRPTQAQIDDELGQLQAAFQTTLQEKQDLGRIAGQARTFTERYPDQAGGYVLLAQTRMALKQWDRSYAAWQAALRLDGEAFELCKMAGFSAAKLEQYEQALAHYQQAVDATNGQADSEVYAAMGRLHLTLGDPDAAEQMFTRAADARGPGKDTNYKHQAYAGLANVAAIRQRFEEAHRWIDRAIKIAKIDSQADRPAYQIQKARIYIDADRDDDAITMLTHTWSEHPEALWRIESARLRAKLHERAGQIDRAADYIQSVAEWHRLSEQPNPNTLANFTALLADWQIKAERIDAARISLHNLQTLVPDHPAIDELKAKLP